MTTNTVLSRALNDISDVLNAETLTEEQLKTLSVHLRHLESWINEKLHHEPDYVDNEEGK